MRRSVIGPSDRFRSRVTMVGTVGKKVTPWSRSAAAARVGENERCRIIVAPVMAIRLMPWLSPKVLCSGKQMSMTSSLPMLTHR
jgi:hypothetical protein